MYRLLDKKAARVKSDQDCVFNPNCIYTLILL